ncbi:MAG TPA: hypothetical protein VNU49_05150 [Opitutaceae bacterium]|jgi:hypothetical protein|nr:hypothetical protein [Opitutaceae bacterium]
MNFNATYESIRAAARVGTDRRAVRSSGGGMFCFEQKITKSRLDFRHQRQKQSRLGNLMRAGINRFVSFVTFCEKYFLENHGAPGGRALPKKSEL